MNPFANIGKSIGKLSSINANEMNGRAEIKFGSAFLEIIKITDILVFATFTLNQVINNQIIHWSFFLRCIF